MAYRKVIIAVDCETDQEQMMVQNIAKEISGTFNIKAKDLINFYPFVVKNKALLYSAVKMVASEGKKGVMKLVPMLLKKL
jgi:hypothetical protein